MMLSQWLGLCWAGVQRGGLCWGNKVRRHQWWAGVESHRKEGSPRNWCAEKRKECRGLGPVAFTAVRVLLGALQDGAGECVGTCTE